MTSHTQLRIWIAAALAAMTFIPLPYLAAPQWDVVVLDDSGSPIEGITVRLVYQNYSAEDKGHEEDRTTNKQGFVSFPARWVSASIVRRCVFTILSARGGVHASFGRHAHVIAFGNGRKGWPLSGQNVIDWTGDPPRLKTQITATARD